MKYWLFKDNQVEGPFDRESLLEIQTFSPESLVCPEGRRGTSMGDWQRAGVVAELAETLLKKVRIPAGAGVGLELGGSLLPPEPTLRDLAVLGTLQEKVSLLENALNQFQDDLRSREEEISSLKTDLEIKKQEAANLETKVGELEVQLRETEGLKQEVSDNKGATGDQAKTIEELRREIIDMRGDLDNVREEIRDTAGKIPAPSPLVGDPPDSSPEPLAEMAAPSLDAPSLDAPEMEAPSLDAPEMGAPALDAPTFDAPPMDAPGFDAPSMEAPDFGMPTDSPPGLEPLGDATLAVEALAAPPGLEGPAPFETAGFEPPSVEPFSGPPSLEDSFAAPEMMSLEAPVEMESLNTPEFASDIPNTIAGGAPSFLTDLGAPTPLPIPGGATPFPGAPGMDAMAPMDMGMADAAATAPPGLVDMTADAPPPAVKKKGGKIVVVLLLMLITGGGLGAAVYMGFIDIEKLSGGKFAFPGLTAKGPAGDEAEDAVAKSAVPVRIEKEKKAPPTLDEPQTPPDRTQEAVEFAKNHPVARTGKSLSELLEGANPKPGLEPWTVSALGRDRYQVNFYQTKQGRRSSVPTYQFEVRLQSKTISALDSKSQSVLDGKRLGRPSRRASVEQSVKRAPRRRQSRARSLPKTDDAARLLADPLGAAILDEPSSVKSPSLSSRRRSQPEEEEEDDEMGETVLPIDKDEEEPSASKNPRQHSRRHQAPKKSREELTLDELLLPGINQP